MSTTSPKLLKSHENKIYAQRVACIDSEIFLNFPTSIQVDFLIENVI